jgi:precorrin-6B methylase 1
VILKSEVETIVDISLPLISAFNVACKRMKIPIYVQFETVVALINTGSIRDDP